MSSGDVLFLAAAALAGSSVLFLAFFRWRFARRAGQRPELATGASGGSWSLAKVEPGASGTHNLESPLLAGPWDDRSRLRDTAISELASAERASVASPHGLATCATRRTPPPSPPSTLGWWTPASPRW